jgi:hypothetical protein
MTFSDVCNTAVPANQLGHPLSKAVELGVGNLFYNSSVSVVCCVKLATQGFRGFAPGPAAWVRHASLEAIGACQSIFLEAVHHCANKEP